MLYRLLFLNILLACLLTSCYRLGPDEDEDTVPITNNPHLMPRPQPNLTPANF